jgi:hypothetical protein
MGRLNVIAMFQQRNPEDYHPVKVFRNGFPPTWSYDHPAPPSSYLLEEVFCLLALYFTVVSLILAFASGFRPSRLITFPLSIISFLGFIFVPLSAIFDYKRLIQEATSISSWPTDKPCPSFWKDGLEERLWALA